ncbi:Oidioi.mRNA.OKI2018_I69.chr1.g2798.t1.cds [Oikopleura dioica]|uniref:Oidioi.mRNA.OKI2018_I69.chr1.g2798.t1.cds n=1 Tax=Oikopleura dioica TaxID=34765 RepID=A0ABN7SYL4_OIKDI|nr:Oidioi.mRNA.OKI2018_I69.chr1.g2798.t1.cds [Oikopleura dioica]
MSYKFVKMFPFCLLTLIILGVWTGLCWEITSRKRLSQAEYLFDGLEEAAGDLINALRSISSLLAAGPTKKVIKAPQDGGSTKMRIKANRNATARASHRISQAMNLGKLDSFGPSDVPARPTITRRNNNNGYDFDSDKDSDKFINRDAQVDMNNKEIQSYKNLSHSIQVSLDKYFAENNIYAKFIEFEEYLEIRASSKQFIRTVRFNRLNTFLVTLICAGTLGYYYIWRLHWVSNAINCKLPEVYWYKYAPKVEPLEEQIWTTTKCYFKNLGTWERFAQILFVLYVFMALFQIIFALSSSIKWKKADRLIKYLPLNCALNRNSISDLHLLVSKVSENEGARKSLAMCDKVLSALEKFEHEEKFLPVLMEVIVWSETDERVGDIVKKVLQPKSN